MLLTRCCPGVFVCDEFVTVTKASDAEWEDISTQLLQVSYLSQYYLQLIDCVRLHSP